MCVYVYLYIHIYTYAYVYIRTHIYTHLDIFLQHIALFHTCAPLSVLAELGPLPDLHTYQMETDPTVDPTDPGAKKNLKYVIPTTGQ